MMCRCKERLTVKCSLSGHEMPQTVAALTSYVSGKKYKKLRDEHDAAAELEKYKQHIVPSHKKHHERQLFCKLTWRHLNKEPVHHILQHVRGKRFTRALARWEHCKETGEKFHPRHVNPVKANDAIPGDEMFADSGDEEAGPREKDDMKDLYPDEDFSSGGEANESTSKQTADDDSDFEDLDDLDSDSESESPPAKKQKKKDTATKTQKVPSSQQPAKKKKKKNKNKQKKQKT